jgi:hypothetical protein
MSSPERLRRVGGLAVSAVAAAPFVYLWVAMMRSADDPMALRARLELAIWIAVFATPWMVAARLLWRTWWRRGRLGSAGPGPARRSPGWRWPGRWLPGPYRLVRGRVPSTYRGHPAIASATLPPATAVVLAAVLAGGLWLALRPPRWLLPDRRARRFGVGMALAGVAGFVATCELGLRGIVMDAGMMS